MSHPTMRSLRFLPPPGRLVLQATQNHPDPGARAYITPVLSRDRDSIAGATGARDRDPRQTMSGLPRAFQPFLTWLTGKPLPGQHPLWLMTPWSHLLAGAMQLATGVGLSVAIGLSARPALWPLYLLTWMITVGAARKLQVMVCHQIVHTKLTGNKSLDRYIVEAITTPLWVQDYTGYAEDHLKAHHGSDYGKEIDPDFAFLLRIGIKPGLSRRKLWRRLLTSLFSPRFHLIFLTSRFRSNFVGAPRKRVAMSVAYLAVFCIVATLTGHLVVTFFAWLFPILILYQASALLQFVCEHRWENSDEPNNMTKLAGFTVGRFCGEPAPQAGLRGIRLIGAWCWWWAKMMLVHLPSRLFVLVGDLPQHDWHHRNVSAKGSEWSNAAYARAKSISELQPASPRYDEVWGLANAIDEVFIRLSKIPQSSQADPDVAARSSTISGGTV